MSSMMWKQYEREQRKRRADRLGPRTEAILHLKVAGYDIEKKSDFMYRVNGCIDLYPIHNRWHDLRTNTRGGAKDLAVWVKTQIHPNAAR